MPRVVHRSGSRGRPKPVGFLVRPITRGLNCAETPQKIDMRETPNALNDRYERGRLRKRSGFHPKYHGCDDTILWLDIAWQAGGGGGQSLVGIGTEGPWELDMLSDSAFTRADAYDKDGNLVDPAWEIDPGFATNIVSVDVGSGRYDFQGANGGNPFPSADDYADIGVMSVGDSGVWVFAYTDVGAAEFERIGGEGPVEARAVVIYDQRIIAGGLSTGGNADYTMLKWSSKGNWDEWSIAGGGGFYPLADSPDWIQSMKRLGEYLIIYKERSIYVGRKTFIADPPFRFDPAPGQGIGLAAPNSIGDLGEEHLFLGWDDVYVFSLKGLQAVGTRVQNELFYGENGILPEHLSLCTGAIAEEFDEYWLFVPTGKWPGTEDDPVENLVPNPIFREGALDAVPPDWASWTDGDGTVELKEGGGVFSPNVVEIALTTGDMVFMSMTPSHNFQQSIQGWKFSVVIWWSAQSSSCNVSFGVRERDGANSLISTHLRDIEISSDDGLRRDVFSHVVQDPSCERLDAQVRLWDPGGTVHVHAMHLVRIDNVEEHFLTGPAGQVDVGYIAAEDAVQPVPLIVDQIGNYLMDTAWVFNYRLNAWSCWRMPLTGFGYDIMFPVKTIGSLQGPISEQEWVYDERRIESFAPTNLLAQPDGRVYECSDEYTRDWEGVFDSPIVTYWESKDFDFDQPTMDKTFARLLIFHATDVPEIEVMAGISLDSGVTWQEQEVVLRNGHIETFVDFFVTGPQARFRFRTERSGFAVNGFSVKVVPRGETNPY